MSTMFSCWRPPFNLRVMKDRDRGELLTLRPPELPSVEGASCLGFGGAPSVCRKTNRDSGITHWANSRGELLYTSCQLATGSFARKLTIPAKNQQKRKLGGNWPGITIFHFREARLRSSVEWRFFASIYNSWIFSFPPTNVQITKSVSLDVLKRSVIVGEGGG